MKRLLSWLLALSLLLSLGVVAAAEEETGLPAVGETVEGFTVQTVRELPFLGGTAVLFEHERTGAKLLYIANSDTERCFSLNFPTRALDNTGAPHVFEHATLSGSDKYPSKALWFNLGFQTYNTYMNATTMQYVTAYPIASLSEAQLLSLADFYTDCCFHPMLMEDESIFREESWRYRLADADAPLTIEGTVYSEMKAAMNLGSSAYYNLCRAAYPGSTIGNVSGGDPAFIPEMTWESLKAYHERYYHPSNCLAYLYGEFEDYTAFLRLLDGAFAPYERREFSFEDSDYTPLAAPVEEYVPFAVEAGSDTAQRSEIAYAFVFPGMDEQPDTGFAMRALSDLLGNDASPLIQKLKKALPGGSFSVGLLWQAPDPLLLVDGENLDPTDAGLFKRTVDEAFAELAETGFSAGLVDSVANAVALSLKLTRENNGVGEAVMEAVNSYLMTTDDAFVYFDAVESLDKIMAWHEDGSYRQLIRDWIVGSQHIALITTYPEAGLREQLDAAEAERLAAVKADMSEAEIAALVEASNAELPEDDASTLVARLQAVTVESLPEEQRIYTVTDETGEDGVRRLFAEAEVDGVGLPLLLLDAAGLTQDEIPWFSLYLSLLGELDTGAHTSEELAALSLRYLYGGSIGLELLNPYHSKDYHPCLQASWIAQEEDLQAGYDLVYELLFDTRFDDADKLLGLIQRLKAALKAYITDEPFEQQLEDALGAEFPYYAYQSAFSGLNYYYFLNALESYMAADPAAVQAKLADIQETLRSRSGAVAGYAGTAAGEAVNRAAADGFLAKLRDEPVERQDYDFPAPAKSSALVVDSTVQYNGVAGSYEAMGLEGYSAELSAVATLVNDLYLVPQLRDRYGVYTPLHGFARSSGAYFVTYRDPNIDETYAAYEALPDFIEGLEIDQEKLNGYILSNYSQLALPQGELSGAASAVKDTLNGVPADLSLRDMRELKTLTPESLKRYGEVYRKLMENGYRFTSGGASAINARAELFDEILNPFGAEDLSARALPDVPEGHAQYEAVRFAFENLLMPARADGSFGVDEEATLGDLAFALSMLGGVSVGSLDEAVETLRGYGLLSADGAVDEALSAQAAADSIALFCAAIGADYAPEIPGETLSRGALAQVLYDFYSALA